MTHNRSLRTVLTALVILSVLVGTIAGPMLAPSSAAQPATPGENGTTVSTNADTNADTTTNTPVTVVNDTNTNTNTNDLENTNTNTNTNNANASAGARSTGSSLDTGGNVTNGCSLPAPGAPFEEFQKLLGNDSAAGDQFGRAVAVDRATETIVIAAPFADNENGTNAGAAYVYERQGGSFVETQQLLTSDGQAVDNFGWSVAIDGWIVSGARLEDENGSNAGAGYVFD